MFDQYLKEAPQFKYNLNIHTDVKFADGDYKDDEKAIRQLGDFITDTVILKLIHNFGSGNNVLTDKLKSDRNTAHSKPQHAIYQKNLKVD